MTRAQAEAHQARHGFCFQPEIVPPQATAEISRLRKRKQPNKIESEYGRILEAKKSRGEIVHYIYEGITLHWGDGMRYTCDWVVISKDAPIKLIEVKGKAFWPGDLVRFKGCRAEWKAHFDMELWQRKGGEWARIH